MERITKRFGKLPLILLDQRTPQWKNNLRTFVARGHALRALLRVLRTQRISILPMV